MEIKTKKIENNLLNKNDMVLDIETTGFSPETSKISIIGYISYKDDAFYAKQVLSKSSNDSEILKSFLQDLNPSHRIISFNGENFDIPFINKRLEKNGIEAKIRNDSLDLYKYIRKNQLFSPYPPVGQKKLEKIFGLERESDLDGKKAVDLYKDYLNSKDDKIADRLLYYNFLDIYNLSLLVEIYYIIRDNKKITCFDRDFYIDNIELIKDKLFILLEINHNPAFHVELIESNYSLEWTDSLKITLDLISGLIDPHTEGKVYENIKDFDLIDKSKYPLKNKLLLIKDEEYNLKNIKAITRETLSYSLKNYKNYL